MKKVTIVCLSLLLLIPSTLVFIGATNRLNGKDATWFFAIALACMAIGALLWLTSKWKHRIN